MCHTQPPKAPGIDESQFPSRSELHDRVRVLFDFFLRLANQHTARHPKMNNPLSTRLCGARAPARSHLLLRMATRRNTINFQIKHNVFSDPPHGRNSPGLQRCDNLLGRRFQRLRLRPQPHRFNHVSSDALIQAARNSFNFRELRHETSLQSYVAGRQLRR